MTATDDQADDVRAGRQKCWVTAVGVLIVPALVLRFSSAGLSHLVEAAVFGLAIVAAAFLLSWAAEVAQLDISAGLALSVVALIAVLPEYAVDAVFTIQGGRSFGAHGGACPAAGGGSSPCELALANMTGGNRLLIGVGWTMVAYLAFWVLKRRGTPRQQLELDRTKSVELSYLAVACAYCLTLPLKRSVTLFDTLVLVAIFVAYTVRLSKAPAEEPHLVGPAAWIGTFPTGRRRAVVVGLFVVACAVILLCADHFAAALVDTGKQFGVSEFLLVQWLAPLASESPELIVAGLYAYRLNVTNGLGALVSSKVNQWTLLVGTLPVVFALSSHSLHGLPIIALQREELLVTAAQSVFAVAVLASLSLSRRECHLLLGLFLFQFVFSGIGPERLHDDVLVGVSVVYLTLAVAVVARDRHRLPRLFRDGVVTPYSDLAEADRGGDDVMG